MGADSVSKINSEKFSREGVESMSNECIKIVGGGLAGSECALQLLKAGFFVKMFEMRPNRMTGAHTTSNLAELVCSNSLKSEESTTASGILKDELDMLGCELLKIARECRVPSGSALAVDREKFSKKVEEALFSYDKFELSRQEVTTIDDVPQVIATGPLTSDAMAEELARVTSKDRLFFFDAVAPIVSADSVDMQKAYFAGRYQKGDDYLNLPMNKEEYEAFYEALISAKTAILHDFENKELFEGCMPIEEMARRGSDTIRFGPLRPIGLRHPVTGEKAYAVVQLRRENLAGDCFNLVGFQTNLLYGEQKRVFCMIPALHDAQFLRYGVMHRNTYIAAPGTLSCGFRMIKSRFPLYIAGQLSGVEGYVESVMSGLVAAKAIACELKGKSFSPLPQDTIVGALTGYVAGAVGEFKPMNANLGVLPPITNVRDKKLRKQAYHDRAMKSLSEYLASNPL